MLADDLLKLFRVLPILDMQEIAYAPTRQQAFPQIRVVAVLSSEEVRGIKDRLVVLLPAVGGEPDEIALARAPHPRKGS